MRKLLRQLTLDIIDQFLALLVHLILRIKEQAALFIALVVVMLFVNAFLRYELSAVIAGMFIMSMLTLAAALLAFLIEVRIATTTLRIGIIQASRHG